jgi:hypothetical protein
MQAEHLEKLWREYCCLLLAFIRGKISDASEAEETQARGRAAGGPLG